MDLVNELTQKNRELTASIRALRDTGTALAKAERDYKIELRRCTLEELDKGTKVSALDKLLYGIPTVAELRFKRDICDVVYKANQDSINATKLQIRIIESQINREWGSNGSV